MKVVDSLIKLRAQNFECFPLDWDTEYFGVKSARVNLKGIITEANQVLILDYCKAFEFITIANVDNIKENNYWIGKKTNAFLTDINIQFEKVVERKPDFVDKFTEVHKAYPRNEKIVDIAKSAFVYSRFFNDPSLPEKQAKNIYFHWTECAFYQKSKYFAVANRDSEIAGYILLSVNEEEQVATIELIAVDEKFRGKQIGKSLVFAIELFAYDNGLKKIKVGTQIDNISAIRFYISCGFQYVSCNSIYHLWTGNIL